MFQVGSIFCSRLELLSRTAAGNRAYVSRRHNATSRRIQTWFLFISQRTLRETSRIFAWKFALNFHVDRIVARKFAAYYYKPRTISRKFAQIKTIDVANCRRDFFSSKISSKSHEKHKFRWSSFALLFHNTVQLYINFSISVQIVTLSFLFSLFFPFLFQVKLIRRPTAKAVPAGKENIPREYPRPLLLRISRAHAIHDVARATSCISSAHTESKLHKI